MAEEEQKAVTKLNLKIRRYLTENEFASDLTTLRAFRSSCAGNNLLEFLERDGLIKPKLRLHWPDSIARRFWLEQKAGVHSLHEPVEPDGSRWDAAVRLRNSLDCARLNLEEHSHPFDDPEPEFVEFLHGPECQKFMGHLERRVSIAHDGYPTLYDTRNIRDFYSGWQILAAAEVTDMGIQIRANMSDPEIARNIRSAILENRLPNGYFHELLEPNSVIREFKTHEAALDATVWFVEEANSALTRILRQHDDCRNRLTDGQARNYRKDRENAAHFGLHRYGVDETGMIAVCQFLAGRWSDWNLEGRPLIAEAYKIYLASAIRILQITSRMNFESIKDTIGYHGNSPIPTLDRVWPNWASAQQERLVQILQTAMNDSPGGLSLDEIIAFAQFVKDEYQDAIFLRLESFERNASTESDAPITGMASDIQGMAVAVEQAVRTMGGKKPQLYQMFREIWVDSPVSKLLKQHKQLAEKKHLPSEWAARKSGINGLRSMGQAESITADLITAHRLRAAVHHQLEEADQLELEKLFFVLLRAVAMTHAQVKRRR